VRPHVEYCTVAWSPHYIKDKQLVEKIQRRFIKMILRFRDKSYEEGLRILCLNTLEERRNRADLIFSLQDVQRIHGTFVPKNFHSRERKFQLFHWPCAHV